MFIGFKHHSVLLQCSNIIVDPLCSLINLLDEVINLLMKSGQVCLVFLHIAPDSIYIAKMFIGFKHHSVLLQYSNIIVDPSCRLINLLDEVINLLMESGQVCLVFLYIAPDSIHIAKMFIGFKHHSVLPQCSNVIVDPLCRLINLWDEVINLLMDISYINLLTFNIIPNSINLFFLTIYK